MASSKKEIKRKTPEEKQKEIEELTVKMDEQISSYFESKENMLEHLTFMSNFYNYSPRNMALIENQFQGAQAVGSFKFWKEKGINITKGEKGIKILVPTPIEYFKRGENLVQVKYATAKEKEQIKNKQIKTEKKQFFSIGHVFEYTQTNAREKGLSISEIFGRYHKDGHIEHDKEMMAALYKIADKVGFEILAEPPTELGVAKGVAYPYEKIIALNPRNTQFENITTLIHELAHAKLHVPGRREELSRNEREFQAEMVSYVVANRYGIDTKDFSLSYLAGWTKGTDLKDKERLLKEVRETSKEFIDTIDNHFEQAKLLEIENDNLMIIQYGSLSNAQIKSVTPEQIIEMIVEKKENDLEHLKHPQFEHNSYGKSLLEEQIKNADLFLNVNFDKDYINKFNDAFKESFTLVDAASINEPKMIIQWSEHGKLKSNDIMRFAEGNKQMSLLEKETQNDTMYYKTRYHVLIPDGKKIDLINMDRLDIGDGYYASPYQQMISEKQLEPPQMNALLNDVALFTHQEKHGEVKLNEPSMMIHGYMKEFQPFGKVNNADFSNIKDKEISYTVAIPDEENQLRFFSGEYEKDKFAFPLHHMEKNGTDKETYTTLENHWHKEISREEQNYIQNWAKNTVPKIHEAEKLTMKNNVSKQYEIER